MRDGHLLADPVDLGDATGIVNGVFLYVDDGAGGRKRSETQAIDEFTGHPLWKVGTTKIETTSWGTEELAQYDVTVPSAERPEIRRNRKVDFTGVYYKATARNNQFGKAQLNEKYFASGYSQPASPAARPAANTQVKENN